jgi:hypothetical protein
MIEKELLSIWYMRDNHTFKKLSNDVNTALIEIEHEFNSGWTHGSLCSKNDGFKMIHAKGSEKRLEFFNECKNELEKWLDAPGETSKHQRIQELAKQAGYTPLPGFDFANELQETFLEKFAELIVRECANIAFEQKKWVEDQEVFNPQDEQCNRARIQQSQRIVDKIKEHFEIEE